MSSKERLNRLESRRLISTRQTETLQDFVSRVTPGMRFDHLKPLTDLFERSRTTPVRACISVPPQHGKSTLVFYLISQVLATRNIPVIYATYSSDFAQKQMQEARIIANRAGLEFDDRGALTNWRTAAGGTLWADGISGSLTGHAGKLIVVDDPVKNWAEAQSMTIRESTYNGFKTNVMTRAHPDTSVFVIHTRWHPDDLIGRLSRDGWETINMPAIDDNGVVLWPEERGLDFIEMQRKELTEHMFASLYQGKPRPNGKEVFRDVHFYEAMPANYTVAIGIDLAYTSKKSSDYSVAVVMAKTPAGSMYVLDILRVQTSAPEFMERLRSMMAAYPGARTRAYIGGGGEQGVLDLFKSQRVFINAIPTHKDKFVRAQPTAAAWNQGRILLPRDRSWLPATIDELRNFTGVNDPHDDIVDAMVGAYDELSEPPPDNSVDIVRTRQSAAMRKNW